MTSFPITASTSLGSLLLRLLVYLFHNLLRVAGVAIGVGLGLGFAIHVRDTLEQWNLDAECDEPLLSLDSKGQSFDSSNSSSKHGSGSFDTDDAIRSAAATTTITLTQQKAQRSSSTTSNNTSVSSSFIGRKPPTRLDASDTSHAPKSEGRANYQSLMSEAGYMVAPVLRGQLIKRDEHKYFGFVDTPDPKFSLCNRGAKVMKEMFPQLPPKANEEIGAIIDLVMRDYIVSWYSKMDNSVVYTDPSTTPIQEETLTGSKGEKAFTSTGCSTSNVGSSSIVYSNRFMKSAPMVDVMYDVLACILGNVGVTAMDQINVLRFVMIKFVDALAKMLKVYRLLRDRAVRRTLAQEEQEKFQQMLAQKVQAQQKEGQQQQQQQQQNPRQPRRNSPQHQGRQESVISGARSPPQRQQSQPLKLSSTSPLGPTRRRSSLRANCSSEISGTAESSAAAASSAAESLESDIRASEQPSEPFSPSKVEQEQQQSRQSRRSSLEVGQGFSSAIQNSLSVVSSPSRAGSLANAAASLNSSSIIEQKPIISPLLPVSEVAVAREFLSGGYLHKALTFGMDVDSLLRSNAEEDFVPSYTNLAEDGGAESCSFGLAEEISSGQQPLSVGALSTRNCPICRYANERKIRGDSCSIPNTGRRYSSDTVLAHRLYHSGIIEECELDYNRVIASQLLKKFAPLRENGSFIIRSMSVEMLAGCILGPTMGLFSPSYINYGVVKMLSGKSSANEILADDAEWRKDSETSKELLAGPEAEEKEGNTVCATISQDEDVTKPNEAEVVQEDDNERLNEGDNKVNAPIEERASNEKDLFEDCDGANLSEEDVALLNDKEDFSLGDNASKSAEGDEVSLLDETEADFGTDTFDEGETGNQPILDFSSKEEENDGEDVQLESSMHEENQIDNDEREEVNDGMHLLPLTTIAVSEVECCMDSRNEEDEVDWDTEYAKNSVCHLVLVIEAVLLNGRKQHIPPSASSNGEKTSLTMLVMEMTADLEGFQADMKRREKEQLQKGDEENAEAGEIDAQGHEATDERRDNIINEAVDPAETSTLRTVIATWLQTGNIYKMLAAFSSSSFVRKTYYETHAFMNQEEARSQFLRQILALDEIEVLVDTLRALSAENTLHEKSPVSKIEQRNDGLYHEPNGTPDGARAQGLEANDDKGNAVSTMNSMLRPWGAAGGNAVPTTGVALGASNAVNAVEKKLTNVRNQMTANRQRLTRWVNIKPGNATPAEVETFPDATPVDATASAALAAQQRKAAAMRKSLVNRSMSAKQGMQSQGALSFVAAQPLPHYLTFHENESFASNMRVERDRREKSWHQALQRDVGHGASATGRAPSSLSIICRPSSERVHTELHQLSHLFYKSTVATRVTLQPGKGGAKEGVDKHDDDNDTADSGTKPSDTDDSNTEDETKSNVKNAESTKKQEANLMKIQCALEVVSARRKIEVPDEDSSFLLRAQPRDLVPVGVHRDQRNPAKSHKVYAASYEVPILCGTNKRYKGARYIRPCLLRYFPVERKAAVQDLMPPTEVRLKETKPNDILLSPGQAFSNTTKLHKVTGLPARFTGEKHSCQKTRAGVASGVMEPIDFAAVPRTGRAIDFVYKMSLFEKPVAEIAGKRFSIHDSSKIGAHKADASARELSDGSLSYILLVGGDLQLSLGENLSVSVKQPTESSSEDETRDIDESLMKSSSSTQEQTSTYSTSLDGQVVLLKMRVVGANKETSETTKKVRPSFIRAALMITAARQDAQLQCLISCVKAGSARQATKSRAEALLRPTASLLEFAASADKQKEQILLRDIGLGITHIDREQLRRNGMIDTREPYILRRLKVKFEDVFLPAATLSNAKPSPVFKIRCLALTEQSAIDQNEKSKDQALQAEGADGGPQHAVNEYCRMFYREEWIIMRPFKDIIAFHKHLKAQVGEAPRFSLVVTTQQKKGKVALVPVLNHNAAKNALTTKKALDRRKLMLNQYFEALLSPSNLLSFSPEVLRFLGAHEPVPENVIPPDTNDPSEIPTDNLGRSSTRRVLLKIESVKDSDSITNHIVRSPARPSGSDEQGKNVPSPGVAPAMGSQSQTTVSDSGRNKSEIQRTAKKGPSPEKIFRMQQRSKLLAYIKSRVDDIALAGVRNSIFDLLRSMFDLDSASFMRSRLFAAIRAMAYLVIGEKDFNKLLIKIHFDYLTGKYVSQWIAYFRDLMWPNGVWYTKKPPLTEEEEKEMELKAKDLLPTVIPDQLRRSLGDELNAEGMAMLHEMFQNKLVVKSFGYMIMDMLWLEMFPAMSDILTGTSSLDAKER